MGMRTVITRACACAVACATVVHAADLATQPVWTTYALTEALVMGRDDQATNRSLVEVTGADPADVLLAPRDLQFPFGGGVRAFYGARNPDVGGWELGYFGLYGQSASASTSVSGDEFLQAPGPLGDDLTSAAQAANVTYNSVINGAEFNLFRSSTVWDERHDAWRTIDWLAGFRYVGVSESAAIDILSCSGDGPLVPYRVRSSTNLFGAQVGTRGRLAWQRWAVEGWAKAALMGAAQWQGQDAVVDWLGYQQRPAASATGGTVGFVGDINLSAIYRLTDVWGIRAGYNTIWIEGVALAPDQFDFGADGPPTTVAGDGGIFLHGANLGLEARW